MVWVVTCKGAKPRCVPWEGQRLVWLLRLVNVRDPLSACFVIAAAASCAVGGCWVDAAATLSIPDPLSGEPATLIPNTQPSEIEPFVESLRRVPKSGLHNPYKNPQR